MGDGVRHPIAEGPFAGGDLAAGLVGEGHGQRHAARERLGAEIGHRRSRPFPADGDVPGLHLGVALLTTAHRQAHSVDAGSRVNVGWAFFRARRPVAKVPREAIQPHRGQRLVGEGHGQQGTGERQKPGRGNKPDPVHSCSPSF